MDQAEDSMPQICQLTELKQTKEWERYLNQFWHLFPAGKFVKAWLGMASRQNEVEARASLSSKQQTARPPSACCWLSHQRPVRMESNVMQCVTTIKEDGAAYTVSTSSLTMEVEAVTHSLHWIASRGDRPHTPSSSQI